MMVFSSKNLLVCGIFVLGCFNAAFGAVGAKKVDVSKVPVEYKHPIATIPYATKKPTIDGTVNDAEWQGAFSQRALRTKRGMISTRQARFWMMWDEENLYVAMRCPLRKGERPIQAFRDPSRDTPQIFDDCYEIWVSAGQVDTVTGQMDCSAKFLSNVSGVHYDTIYQPNVGNERVGSYETGWKPKNRINEKNEWEMELVIPRKSLGTTKSPFHDGQHLRVLIARNFKRPWEQNSFEGTSAFSVIDKHSLYILSKTAPALHLLSVSDTSGQTLGLNLAAYGQSDMKIKWSYTSPDVSKTGQASVTKGKLSEVVNALDLDKPGNGMMRITVTDEAGRPLLDWATLRQFKLNRQRKLDEDGNPITENGRPVFVWVNEAETVLDDKGDVIKLTIAFNPIRDYARVVGDFIDFDRRNEIATVNMVVKNQQGKEVARNTCKLDANAYVQDVIRFNGLPFGNYAVVSECKDKDGKVIETIESTFSKDDLAKKYDWYTTKRGNIEKVIKPWTPVTLKGDMFGVWGREMTIGPAGLPKQITTQGKALFAKPAELVVTNAEGKSMVAAGMKTKTLFDKDYRKTVQVDSQLGNIAVKSDVQVEFDGLYKVTMTLDPKKPTPLKNLKIVLPLSESMADYIHASAALIRAGYYYGPMPKGKGQIWNCTQLGDATMLKGSFIPYIWIGSPRGGLAWFADSDEGWVPSDKTPALEIHRNQEEQVELVLNLISEPYTLDKPRTITFGLQASPVKKMHDRWREDKWWCGDSFKNYAHKENMIFASTPFAVESYIDESKKMVEAQHKSGQPAVPYFIHSVLPASLVPEMAELSEEWTTHDVELGEKKALCYRGCLIDFMINSWGRWAEQTGIDGLYVDNMRPIKCDKIEHGCGYRLPDGRIQPSYPMFGTREYFLRSRAVFEESVGHSKIVLHMTNAMILPWIGAADVTFDGEHYVIYPEMKKDFMDFWPINRLRADVPEAWGTAVNFMHEYQGVWDPVDLHRAMRAYIGEVALHDILPTGNNNGHAHNFVKQRKEFGIGDDDVTFLGYWQSNTGLSIKGKDVKLAGWLKPNKMLLMVVNFGEKQMAEVTIEPAKLGWGNASFTVKDAELGYKHYGSKRVNLTEKEMADMKAGFEKNDANRIKSLKERYEKQLVAAKKAGKPAPQKPDFTPRTYRPRTWKYVKLITWDGDKNVPIKQNGNTLSVPVERHNYRLLILEKTNVKTK